MMVFSLVWISFDHTASRTKGYLESTRLLEAEDDRHADRMPEGTRREHISARVARGIAAHQAAVHLLELGADIREPVRGRGEAEAAGEEEERGGGAPAEAGTSARGVKGVRARFSTARGGLLLKYASRASLPASQALTRKRRYMATRARVRENAPKESAESTRKDPYPLRVSAAALSGGKGCVCSLLT